MPRRPRVVVEGGVYHVYNRVVSGEAVVGEAEEARRFVELIREVKRRDGWTRLRLRLRRGRPFTRQVALLPRLARA